MLDWLSHPLFLIGAAAVAGLLAAVFWYTRRRPPAPVTDDELEKLRAWIARLRAMEVDLITAGQALGKARRYLDKPGKADALITDLRVILVEAWLQRLDLEGRLRLASVRRRLPPPPPPSELHGSLDVGRASVLIERLSEWMELHRSLANRCEESARALLKVEPSLDAHARYVGSAVEQATAHRRAQVDALHRLAARIQADGERCGAASLALAAMLPALAEAPKGGLPVPEALAELSSLGLDDSTDHDHVFDEPAFAANLRRGEASAEAALALARDAVQLDEPPPPTPGLRSGR